MFNIYFVISTLLNLNRAVIRAEGELTALMLSPKLNDINMISSDYNLGPDLMSVTYGKRSYTSA